MENRKHKESSLIYVLVVVLVYIPDVTSENPFACNRTTIRPLNGLPFYEILNVTLNYDDALTECQRKGADLLILRTNDSGIIADPDRIWVSARRRYWTHVSLDLGLTFSTWAEELRQSGQCVALTGLLPGLQVALVSMLCDEELEYICSYDYLGEEEPCEPDHIYEYQCHEFQSSATFMEANNKCKDMGGHLLAISDQKQLDWLQATFPYFPTWTGYQYNDSNTNFFWSDGTRLDYLEWIQFDQADDECVVMTENGQLKGADCEQTEGVACVLDVPYAGRNVVCTEYDQECLCYWPGNTSVTFDEAMVYCLSDGGTLFYPNNEAKFDTLSDYAGSNSYWIGISDGFVGGLFRGSDSSVISWASWSSNQPSSEAGYDCVVFNSSYIVSRCDKRFNSICQSKPDPELYPCVVERGCLLAYDDWSVRKGNCTGSEPEMIINNVDRIEKCWEICIGYIGSVCEDIIYNYEEMLCGLMPNTLFLQGSDICIQRTKIDSPELCTWKFKDGLNYLEAVKACPNQWKLLFIDSESLNIQVELFYWQSWLDIQYVPEVGGVFVDGSGTYITYSAWASNEPTLGGNCVYIDTTGWRVSNCSDSHDVVCRIEKEQLCSKYPTISNGKFSLEEDSVTYSCNEGYFMPTQNVTQMTILCSCRWAEDLELVENCTIMQCASPSDIDNGTLVKVYGLNVFDNALYGCPFGYVVAGTNDHFYNLTCLQSSVSAFATWSEPPELEVANCWYSSRTFNNATLNPADLSLDSAALVICNDGFQIFNSTENATETWCVMDDSGFGADWCWTPPCELVSCPDPDLLPNASLVSTANSTLIGTVLTYECDEDFVVARNGVQPIDRLTFNRTCVYDEQARTTRWSGNETCFHILCPEPEQLPNARLLTTGNSSLLGTVLRYECDEDFAVLRDGVQVNHTNTFNRTCTYDSQTVTGLWTGNETCTLSYCEQPPLLPRSSLSVNSTLIHSTANYTCDLNYRISAAMTTWTISNCTRQNGSFVPEWSPVELCSPVTCDEPAQVPNATILSSSQDVGGITRYACDFGHIAVNGTSIQTGFETTCYLENNLVSANWSDTQICEVLLCAEPPEVENCQVEASGYHLADTATYTCDPNYIIDPASGGDGISSSQQSICMLDMMDQTLAFWSPIPQCVDEVVTVPKELVRYCESPQSIAGASLYYKDLFIKSIAVYTSKESYVFEEGGTARTSICNADGQWSTEIGVPTKNTCPALSVDGATVSTEDVIAGTQVEVRCIDPTARMENGLSVAVIMCADSGKWTFQPQSCKRERCEAFGLIEHSRLVAFNNTVGGQAVVSCDKSYSFDNGLSIDSFRCLPSLTWEQYGPCLINTCPAISVPANATLSTDIAVEGTVVEVSCLPGYMFADTNTTSQFVVCTSLLQWNTTLEDCKVLRCGDAPILSNGTMTPVNTLYNSTITYTCDKPYRMENGYQQLTSRCQEDGRWTYETVSCDVGRCPPLPVISNAKPSSTLALAGSIVTYTCDEGYVLASGQKTVTAYCDGQTWNVTETACIKVNCPPLNLTHAIWEEAGNDFGALVEFHCEEGYVYGDDLTGVLQCQANSEWSVQTAGCSPIDCGAPPTVTFSRRDIPLNYFYGAVVTYSCLPDYWFREGVTNVTATCTKEGRWSSVAESCTLITCPPIPVWDDMEADTTDNVVGTAVKINCTTDDLSRYSVSYCTRDGVWEPPLDQCKTLKTIVFEPEPEEAEGSGSIGIVIMLCIGTALTGVVISDMPNIIRTMKGQTVTVRRIKKKHA